MPFPELQRRSNNLTSNSQGTPKSTTGSRPRSRPRVKIRPPRRVAAPAPSTIVVRCAAAVDEQLAADPGSSDGHQNRAATGAPVIKKDRFFIRRRREDGRKSAHGKGKGPAGRKKILSDVAPWPRPFFSALSPLSLHHPASISFLAFPLFSSPCFCPHRPTRNRQPSGAGGLVLAAHALALCCCSIRARWADRLGASAGSEISRWLVFRRGPIKGLLRTTSAMETSRVI